MDDFDKLKLWLFEAIQSFEKDKASSRFQLGYLEALLEVKKEIERIEA